MTELAPTRRPYRGSCHCGEVQYVVFLTFPHTPPPPRPRASRSHQEFYRCNCTICHKAGFFHMRLKSAPDDFLLLKPRDPYRDLGDYQVNEGRLHFLFCKTCGTRCFILMGQGGTTEVDLETLGVADVTAAGTKENEAAGAKMTTTVWRPKKDGWNEGKGCGSYLSVNGYSVDAGQDGFDLREMTNERWVGYLDLLELHQEGSQGTRYDQPWEGGAY